MAKSMIINVNFDNSNTCVYVTYSSGTEKTYPENKLPKTVQAWIKENVQNEQDNAQIEPEIAQITQKNVQDEPEAARSEPEVEVVEQEVVPVEQEVVQAVEQAPKKTPRTPIINTSDMAILSYFWDLESLLLILIHAGLIGTVWILEGAVKVLPVIRAVITETAGAIQEITGWICDGADLVKEAVVYVGALL